MRLTWASLTLIVLLLGPSEAIAGHNHFISARDHRRALTAEREARHADQQKQPRVVGPSASEKRAIAQWGGSVGRWWDECARYWPDSQMRNVMYCIRGESGGNPNAHNGIYHGLFQLGGFTCNVWAPLTNIRLAYGMWQRRGWQPWAVM